jgi:hypothetical protein
MNSVALSGNDIAIFNNRSLSDLADQDAVRLAFANAIASVKTGKNGNSIYAENKSGEQCEVSLRILRGSADDKYMNGLLVQQKANFAGFPLMTGVFIKQVGIGGGNVSQDTYILSGGVFTKNVEAKSNADGDTEQSLSMYTMMFTLAPRVLA